MVQTKISRVEEFLIRLQKSREQATKTMEEAQKTMKRQLTREGENPQGLKVSDNMWLETRTSFKLTLKEAR